MSTLVERAEERRGYLLAVGLGHDTGVKLARRMKVGAKAARDRLIALADRGLVELADERTGAYRVTKLGQDVLDGAIPMPIGKRTKPMTEKELKRARYEAQVAASVVGVASDLGLEGRGRAPGLAEDRPVTTPWSSSTARKVI